MKTQTYSDHPNGSGRVLDFYVAVEATEVSFVATTFSGNRYSGSKSFNWFWSARARDEAPVTKPSKKPAGSKIPVSSTVQEYTRNRIADQQHDWKQPINFFGRVVDESDHSVPGAVAHFKWTDLSENGTSESSTESDSAGLFSLLGRKGKRMSVTVAKDGYYTPLSERMSSYEYANPAEGLFWPDLCQSNWSSIFSERRGPGPP